MSNGCLKAPKICCGCSVLKTNFLNVKFKIMCLIFLSKYKKWIFFLIFDPRNLIIKIRISKTFCMVIMWQAVLWNTDSLKPKTTLEEHSALITDVRFSPSMSRLATSSFDKTVRVWDADNVSWTFFLVHNSFYFFNKKF